MTPRNQENDPAKGPHTLRRSLPSHLLMHIAPQPALPLLSGTDHRMPGPLKVLRRMAILRRVTASHMPALQARPQMHPFIAQGNALRAHMHLRRNVTTMHKILTT